MVFKKARVRFPTGLPSVHTGCGAHPVSYTMVAGVKRLGREADHSLPSRAEVKNGGAIPPLHRMSSWHSA
jgi:hypothetical protein